VCNTSHLNNTVELIWNHSFGQQEQQDLVICRPWALTEGEEDAEMLDSGWLLLDHRHRGRECWYQSRSTRVDIDRYSPRFRKHQHDGVDITVKTIHPRTTDDLALTGIHAIYQDYIERKGFRDLYDPLQYLDDRTQFLLYYLHDRCVGFTKMRVYHWQESMDHYTDDLLFPEINTGSLPGIESVLHASSLPISAMTLDMEIQWARDLGAHCFYMGPGYERGSEYKCSYKGFEWWTGEKWSTQKKSYRRLCKRDSDLEMVKDLGNAK